MRIKQLPMRFALALVLVFTMAVTGILPGALADQTNYATLEHMQETERDLLQRINSSENRLRAKIEDLKHTLDMKEVSMKQLEAKNKALQEIVNDLQKRVLDNSRKVNNISYIVGGPNRPKNESLDAKLMNEGFRRMSNPTGKKKSVRKGSSTSRKSVRGARPSGSNKRAREAGRVADTANKKAKKTKRAVKKRANTVKKGIENTFNQFAPR